MKYPDWFRAQVAQAVTLHGLSYLSASHLYDVAEETTGKWVNAADEFEAGRDLAHAVLPEHGRTES